MVVEQVFLLLLLNNLFFNIDYVAIACIKFDIWIKMLILVLFLNNQLKVNHHQLCILMRYHCEQFLDGNYYQHTIVLTMIQISFYNKYHSNQRLITCLMIFLYVYIYVLFHLIHYSNTYWQNLSQFILELIRLL